MILQYLGQRMMSDITNIFDGNYVHVDLVDTTVELTVEGGKYNIYSRSEALDLIKELKSVEPFLLGGSTYSQDKHEITVVIEGGMCVDVRGLPEEWDYAIEDYDMEKQG